MRAARVAAVLAKAVRDAEISPVDALRILRHELRRRNTNAHTAIPVRSGGAQAAIDHYGEGNVPRNGSPHALHADHVYPLTELELRSTRSVEAWVAELRRVEMVVCVTAEENYRLMRVEKTGLTGPAKYARAGVTFTTDALPWSVRLDAKKSAGAAVADD